MLITIASFLIATLNWLGWGYLSGRILSRAGLLSESPSWEELCILGIFALTFLSMTFGIFMPLAAGPSLGLAIAGILSALTFLLRCGRFSPGSVLKLLFLGIPFCVLANRGWMHIDSGGYHTQMVEWMAVEPIPLGLGNLHSRYGFNSSWHTLAAGLYLPFIGISGSFAANASLGFVFFSFLFREIRALLSELPGGGIQVRFSLVFLLLLFLSLTVVHPGRRVVEGLSATPSTDLPAFYLMICAWIFYLGKDRRSRINRLTMFLAAFALAVSVKFSVFLTGLLAIPLLWDSREITMRRKTLALSFCALFGSVWCFRTYLLTGCLLYPMSSTCLSPPFGMPLPSVEFEYVTLRAWARVVSPENPLAVLQDTWSWIPQWMRHQWKFEELFRFTVWIHFASMALIALNLVKRTNWKNFALYPVLAGVFSFLVWFFQSPSPRYNYGIFLGTPLMLFSYALVSGGYLDSFKDLKRLSRGLKVLTGVCLAFFIWKATYNAKGIKKSHLFEPWPRFPALNLQQTDMGNGLRIHRAPDGMCWNAPASLLCAPGPLSSLKMDWDGKRRTFYP